MPSLPRSTGALTIATFESALVTTTAACDLRRLSFVDAYGLVALACALRAAFEETGGVDVRGPDSEAMLAHLTAMGFSDFLTTVGHGRGGPLGSALQAPDVVVPLRFAADSGGAQALSHVLWESLRDHVAPQVLRAITEGVWEMVGNALEHSGSDALIAGQVYTSPRGIPPHHDDRVQVVIGDTGRGLRASFLSTGLHEPATDLEAIHLGLKYLVTSVPHDPGRGQGLFTTMEEVVAVDGRMTVRSGAARVTVDAAGRHEEDVRCLPGVIVALSLPLYPGLP